MTIEIYLVDATHCLLSMVTTAYRIAMTGEGFMKKLPGHVPERKHHKEKYGDQFFYGLRAEQAENLDEGSEL